MSPSQILKMVEMPKTASLKVIVNLCSFLLDVDSDKIIQNGVYLNEAILYILSL